MTTIPNGRSKIYRNQDNLPNRKSTDNSTEKFQTMTSQLFSRNGSRDTDHFQSMNSTDTSILQHGGKDTLERTPQPKRSASNSVGFFRPFDTPPRKIQKLSIDSNNNFRHLTDTDREEQAFIVSRLSTDSGVDQNRTKKISTVNNNNKSGAKPSIFRTIDQLAYSSPSKTPVSVQASKRNQFGTVDNFCTSTPLPNHRMIKPSNSPLSLMAGPLTFDTHLNFRDYNQEIGTPTNILASNRDEPALLQDMCTPPYTPDNIVRPTPRRHLPPPPKLGNLHGERYSMPFSGKVNDISHKSVVPQLNVNTTGSSLLHRDFKTQYNTDIGFATQLQPYQTTATKSHNCNQLKQLQSTQTTGPVPWNNNNIGYVAQLHTNQTTGPVSGNNNNIGYVAQLHPNQTTDKVSRNNTNIGYVADMQPNQTTGQAPWNNHNVGYITQLQPNQTTSSVSENNNNNIVEYATRVQPNQTTGRVSGIDYNQQYQFVGVVTETANDQLSHLDFKSSKTTVTGYERQRSVINTQDPGSFVQRNFSSGEDHLQNQKTMIDSVNGGNFKQVSPTSSSNSGETQGEISDEELIDVTTLDARFECRVCQKVFSQQRLLDRHAKRHSDVKRSICTFCNKGFSDAFDLKRHVRTHTGVRPFKCEDCDKAFTQRGSLELHTSKVHKRQLGYAFKERRNKVFVCEQCGHSEEQANNYYKHLELMHPNGIASFNSKTRIQDNSQAQRLF